MFKKINEAKDVLTDKQKRQQYDLGMDPNDPSGGGGDPFGGMGGMPGGM